MSLSDVPAPTAPTLFVFDLDGTLVDSQRDIAESANAVLESCGYAPHSQTAIAGMVGEGAALLIARAFAVARAEAPPDALQRFLRVYGSRLLQHTRPYPGIPELLDALGARGSLAVLTNKPIEATRQMLDGLGLARYFGDRVLGGDGPHPRKPDPAGLRQLMAAKGHAPSDTLMVGDSVIDLRTARAAGTQAAVAMYGFGFAQLPPDELLPTDRLLSAPLDLLRLL